MTKANDAAMQVASVYLRANPDASLDQIAEVISQFGGLSGLGELDEDDESRKEGEDTEADSE